MDAFERAAQREIVDYQRLGFRIHLFVYLAVQALLIVTWALTTGTDGDAFPWFIFPLLGWGIGLAAHYAVYSVVRKERRAVAERTSDDRLR
jgi:hypothetical protein